MPEQEKTTQQVFRLGLGHNKWIVVLPSGVFVNPTIPDCLPEIIKALEARLGPTRIAEFDHIEYLGCG